MPGFDTERFVNLSQNDKAELICSICQDILCNPVVAQCCQQSFCEDCINDWLKNNNTCPYDRKTMTSSGLSRPPRIMLNMLGKLKIHCNYKENGCNEVLLLETLSQHTVKCRYNIEKCQKCLCEIPNKLSHDCIKTLLELNRKANEEIETLKAKLQRNSTVKMISPTVPSCDLLAQNSLREQSLLKENRELKAEKENFLKTIQDLSNNQRQQNISKTTNFSELFKHARKQVWNPEMIENDMRADIASKVLSIVRDELVKECNSVFVVCKNTVEILNTEYGSLWHCMVSDQKSAISWCIYERRYLITFKHAEVFFNIYKTKSFNIQEFIQRFRNGKIKPEIQILKTVMNESMISDVKKITFAAIEKSNSLVEIASEIKKQMDNIYPGNWQCFLYANFGTCSIRYKSETYIYFNVDNLTVTIFQASVN